jgi:hypothetical protein
MMVSIFPFGWKTPSGLEHENIEKDVMVKNSAQAKGNKDFRRVVIAPIACDSMSTVQGVFLRMTE